MLFFKHCLDSYLLRGRQDNNLLIMAITEIKMLKINLPLATKMAVKSVHNNTCKQFCR